MSKTKEKHTGKIAYSPILALKEFMLEGNPITNLEASALLGVQSLWREITNMRRAGWEVHSRKIPMVVVVRRMNEYATFQPPKDLPIMNIKVTEYWVTK